MQELTTRASLVEYGTSPDPITATLSRRELETVLDTDDSAGIWFEFGEEEDEEGKLLTAELGTPEIEEILRSSSGDNVVLALDPAEVLGLFDEPEVQGHGLRGALAIAVVSAAVAAPAGMAAAPQAVDAAATVQRARAATSLQQTTTTQVSTAVTGAQVSSAAARAQITRSLKLNASGVTRLRGSSLR